MKCFIKLGPGCVGVGVCHDKNSQTQSLKLSPNNFLGFLSLVFTPSRQTQ